MDISIGIGSRSNMDKDPDKYRLTEFMDCDIRDKIKEYFIDKCYGQGVLTISSGIVLLI